MTKKTETYLGDGVYATFDGFQIWVRVETLDRGSMEIALEPSVLKALNDFDAAIRRQINDDAENKMSGDGS